MVILSVNDIYLLANIIPPKRRIIMETHSGRKQWKTMEVFNNRKY